jgi:hypothetical protein
MRINTVRSIGSYYGRAYGRFGIASSPIPLGLPSQGDSVYLAAGNPSAGAAPIMAPMVAMPPAASTAPAVMSAGAGSQAAYPAISTPVPVAVDPSTGLMLDQNGNPIPQPNAYAPSAVVPANSYPAGAGSAPYDPGMVATVSAADPSGGSSGLVAPLPLPPIASVQGPMGGKGKLIIGGFVALVILGLVFR